MYYIVLYILYYIEIDREAYGCIVLKDWDMGNTFIDKSKYKYQIKQEVLVAQIILTVQHNQ